jgi:cyclic pyranopterin phosphate synthase
MAGINDDEILDFATKTIDDGWNVRFIELMPVNSDNISRKWFFPVNLMQKRLEHLGPLEPCLATIGNGPAKYYRLPNASGTIGFITPVSEHFCFCCNRLRLTSDGKLRPCLLDEKEIDLKQPLCIGKSITHIMRLIEEAVAHKPLKHRLSEGYIPEGRPFSRLGG